LLNTITELNSTIAQPLAGEVQEILEILRAELHKLLGNYAEALQVLQRVYWRTPFLQTLALRLEGDIAELRGAAQTAIQAYQRGWQTVEELLRTSAEFQRDLGYLYTHERDFSQAEQSLLRLRYETASLAGYVHERKGDLVAALKEYQEALSWAQQTRYPYGVANTHNNLGRIYAWQRNLTEAEAQLDAAISFFEMTGHQSKLASATYNLAFARRLAEHYQEAIAPAVEALRLFERLDENFGKATSAQILAEVHLALGNLAQAEQLANYVIGLEHTTTQPDALRTLGEIHLKQGKLTEAEQAVRASLVIAQTNQDKVLEAYAWRALGEVQLAKATAEEAQSSLLHAVRLFTEMRLVEETEKANRLQKHVSVENQGPRY
jgi:tetratricopeptide (TPR) repeat protein